MRVQGTLGRAGSHAAVLEVDCHGVFGDTLGAFQREGRKPDRRPRCPVPIWEPIRG